MFPSPCGNTGPPPQPRWIDSGQNSFVAAVQPLESSEYRGLQLANQIESYMATTGARHVNLVGHSQGGIDIRKAARVYGDVVYGPGNDAYAAVKSLIYNDYAPNDGKTTGLKLFNEAFPVNPAYGSHYVSLMTAQHGLDVNPALYLLRGFYFDPDADGFCADDCDNDGAAGKGDGVKSENDDDGLVGINSQQMGYRLRYTEQLGLDKLTIDTSTGYVSNINAPNATQMTSHSSLIIQDHLDVIGLGPDMFEEMDFYGAIFDYIAKND